MRRTAENIARRSNKEDRCTGRFWEGRYKAQLILDEASLLACATYVDLNPIRAAIAKTPEGSDFTSVQQRICLPEKLAVPLVPFADEAKETDTEPLPIDHDAYLELVDWTGRAVVQGKRGAIPASRYACAPAAASALQLQASPHPRLACS